MNSALTNRLILPCFLAFILMAGCSAANQNPPTPTTSPTVAAIPTGLPSPTPYPATSTPEITLTSTLPSTQPNSIAATAKASFVRENHPDNSVLKPGEKFVKTFELKNSGSTPWTTSYSLVLDSAPQNETLGSPSQVNLPQETPPGGTVSLSISLAAPTKIGTYTVYWSLKNERGETIPVDGGKNIWAKILVCDPNQPCNPPIAAGGITANGISVTLTSFTHDAQSATVDFCMTTPNRNYALGSPAPSLLVDQKPAPFLDGGTIQPWGCYEMKYQISAAQIEQAQQITLLIDTALRMSPPPGDPDTACQFSRPDLLAKYPGLDFQCHFSMAGYYTNLRLPDRMMREQAQQIITDAIEGAIYGPWVLTIK